MSRQLSRDVAIVSYAEYVTPIESERNEVEMLIPVVHEALSQAGLQQSDIDFTVSGSSDYLQGFPFAFVNALDAIGAWPPIKESHLEMDGAFALYEAALVLQHGDAQTALVYAFGRPSRGELDRTLALQLDPYLVAPLWPDARSLAGLQAQAMRDSGRFGEVPEVPPTPVFDGCAAVVLAVGDRARELTDTPVWIRGIDHRIEPAALGLRDLSTSPSAKLAAAGAQADGPVDVAALHVAYPHQTQLLSDALGLAHGTRIEADFGPVMAGGLMRFGAAFQAIRDGAARAIAHTQSGPCMQQNLVAVLEGAA